MAAQGGKIVDGNYVPTFPPERGFYEAMWKYVNPSGTETLAGQDAVPFFQKSGVDIGILRQIWSLSTVANVMRKENFFTALRYITMVQNGEIPLNFDKLESSCSVQFPAPKFTGVQLPPTPPPAAPLPPPQAYAMTPEELAKYVELFKTYDSHKAGVLPQQTLMPILLKSGIPLPVVSSIWTMSDVDKDTMLSATEFAIAFHLILCLSKKHLPLPPGLPAPLLALCQQQQQPTLPPARRESFNEPTPPKPKQEHHLETHHVETHAAKPLSATEVNLLPPTLSSSPLLQSSSSGSLKYLLQRVVTEKISLSASVTNSEGDIDAIKERLTTSLAEINGLESEIEELRNNLVDGYRLRGAVQSDEARAKADRDRLLLVVAEGRRELARLTGDQIEPSALLAQIGDRIAASASVRHSHTGAGPSEATGLGTEIDALRVVLADLATERSRVGAEAEKLRDDLSKAEASLGPLLQSSAQEEQQLEAMRAENDRLRSDLESLLQQLAKLNSLTATVPAPVSPLAPAASQSLGSQKPSPSFSSGFDHSLAVGDSGFGESNGFEDQPAASAADFHSGFEADTGFDSFGAGSSLPATADGDGFASGFGSDGFDSFSASASPAAAVTSPNSAFASDGFGAFGASPSPAAASASSGDNKSSAFNAFDAFDF